MFKMLYTVLYKMVKYKVSREVISNTGGGRINVLTFLDRFTIIRRYVYNVKIRIVCLLANSHIRFIYTSLFV